jgi:hypothetical protein
MSSILAYRSRDSGVRGCGEPEYEEIVEVYEEEVPVQEGAPEPSTTNFAAHWMPKASPGA